MRPRAATALALAAAIAGAGCRDERKPGLPPASDWNQAPQGAPRQAPARQGGFAGCLLQLLGRDPSANAHVLGIVGRTAPAGAAREVLLEVVRGAARFTEGQRPKIYGEAAWALAKLGAKPEAARTAALALQLPHVADGGSLTAIAAAALAGDLAAAERAAGTDMIRRDAAAYGAALGGERARAQAIRRAIEADPAAVHYVRSAIHLKTLVALGERAAVEQALNASTNPLFDAAAVAEAGAQAGDAGALALARRTILAAPEGPRTASSLLQVAGSAAAARLRAELDATAAALAPILARLPAETREDLSLGLALSYVTIGDPAAARPLLAQAGRHPARWMVGQEIASLEGRWDAIVPGAGGEPLYVAGVWARAAAAKLAPEAMARVEAALCP